MVYSDDSGGVLSAVGFALVPIFSFISGFIIRLNIQNHYGNFPQIEDFPNLS